MTGGGVGGFTADDATAGIGAAGGSSSSTSDLYGLGAVGNGPIYSTQSESSMGENSGGGKITYTANPNNVTGNSYAQSIAALSQSNPAAFQQWQQMLYAADFYSGKPRFGVFSSADMNALGAALTAYQQVNGGSLAAIGQGKIPATPPQAFQDWLNQRITQVKATGGPGATTKQPLQVQLTDPTEIKASLQAGAQDALGRNLTDTELSSFVAKFQGLEKTAQTSAYNGASEVTPPDLSGQTAQYLISQHGPEHDEKQAAGFLDSLANKLGVLT